MGSLNRMFHCCNRIIEGRYGTMEKAHRKPIISDLVIVPKRGSKYRQLIPLGNNSQNDAVIVKPFELPITNNCFRLRAHGSKLDTQPFSSSHRSLGA